MAGSSTHAQSKAVLDKVCSVICAPKIPRGNLKEREPASEDENSERQRSGACPSNSSGKAPISIQHIRKGIKILVIVNVQEVCYAWR